MTLAGKQQNTTMYQVTHMHLAGGTMGQWCLAVVDITAPVRNRQRRLQARWTAAQQNRVRHNCFVERQRNGDSERAVASNKTVKNIDAELGGALVNLHQAQLRLRGLHVCVATRRRAVWTRGAVSTASCPPPN